MVYRAGGGLILGHKDMKGFAGEDEDFIGNGGLNQVPMKVNIGVG